MNLLKVANILVERAFKHDNSKFSEEEYFGFLKISEELKKVEYGSKEYKDRLNVLNETLEHHYSVNNHHPEHYDNGIDDMSIIDLIEMVCDWKAASERYKDGDIWKSMKINKERFNIDNKTYYYLSSLLNELDQQKGDK